MKDLFISSILLLACVLGSLLFLSPSWIELQVGKRQIDPNNIPSWIRWLYKDTIFRATSANWSSSGAYFGIAIGMLFFGAVVSSGIWKWYRYGFDSDHIALSLALLVWLAIIYWHSKLGR